MRRSLDKSNNDTAGKAEPFRTSDGRAVKADRDVRAPIRFLYFLRQDCGLAPADNLEWWEAIMADDLKVSIGSF